jgi:2-keto-4-pentenoate hydratase/2-oxohepta-3-ene-1,7-dioic acid hydratase in catechol pathway
MPFRFANVAGRSALVDPDDRWYDLDGLTGGVVPADPMAALRHPEALHEASAGLGSAQPGGRLADAVLGAPVPAPRNAFGIGLNYRPHAEESSMALPERPLVFGKFPSCIVGPRDQIELRSTTTDWEVELVVVIGTPGRDIAATDAWSHILGLTVGQDISDRELQMASKPPHFDLGKSRDTYGPMGPVLVSTDSFDDPTDLAISCDVNDQRKQEDRTSSLLFSVGELIEYLSAAITLDTGDVIFTGTPAGVGAPTRTFLEPGDVVTSTIEGIGTMVNTCR